MRKRLLTFAAAGVLACAFVSAASASTIRYEATDLADTTPGQDLWQYTYVVSGYAFAAGKGFSILFGPPQFESLSDPTPDTDPADGTSTDADWDVLLLQPDNPPSASGRFDALAMRSPSSHLFSTRFVWNGPGKPGSQPFEIYDYDGQTIEVVETGRTTPIPVPEPAVALLLALGLGLGARRRRD